MKWPFRRNKDVASVPEEIKEYYQSERRERTGIAWLLALGTLLITIALAILLFFAGRWIYRAVFDKDDSNRGDTSQVEQNPSDSNPEEGSPAPGTPETAPTPGSTGTSSTATDGSGSTQGTQTTPATPNATTPVTGEGLPNTGPGDILALFAITTVAGATAHYAVSSRRSE